MEQADAGKSPVSGENVWALLSSGSRIYVARNKAVLEFDPKHDEKEQILANVRGRTGNLRAPTLRIGTVYYVGFNEELYGRLCSE